MNIDRYNYGEYAVLESYKTLRERQVWFKSSKSHFGDAWCPHVDKLWGDVVITIGESNYYFDVKRNSVSIDSLNAFVGDYFVVYHHTLKDNVVIPREHLKGFQDKYTKEPLRSGDLGIKYWNFYDKGFMDLNGWISKTLSEHEHINI